MRIVVFGAGAVGSVIGGRLFQHAAEHGHDVALVARASHCAAISAGGLVLNDPAGSDSIAVPAFESIEDIALTAADVVILTMKTNDTPGALDQLVCHAPDVSVVCAQNGVENERLAVRKFENVYGVCVMLPASFMDPGVVDAFGAPLNAILDVGRYPGGTDETSDSLAAAFEASHLASRSVPDIMRWKYRKLLMNLANAVDALIEDPQNCVDLLSSARDEAIACFAAAGIDAVGADEDQARRKGVMKMAAIPGSTGARTGGSTWQSIARGAGSTEVDWLNGEIVLLGRLHGVPTPVNSMFCASTRWAAASRRAPRSMTTQQMLERAAERL